MIPWWQRPFFSFDLETTGVNTRADRIVTATLLHIDPTTGDKEAREWLADPGVEIPKAASDVHGVTTERARAEGRPAVEVVAEIAEALREVFDSGEALVVYNAPFDFTMTGCEVLRHFGDASFRPTQCVVDPLVIDYRLNPFVRGKGARKLVNTCKRNGIVLSEQDAHTSAGDTLAAGRLGWKQASSKRLIGGLALDELHQREAGWFESQQLDFANWLAQKDLEAAARCRAEAATWPMHELRLEEMTPPEPPPVAESDGEVPF